MRALTLFLSVAVGSTIATGSNAYPLDGAEATGIHRLEAFNLAQESLLKKGRLQPGSLWTTEQVTPRLSAQPDFAIPAPDPEIQAALRSLVGSDAPKYGIAVLDISDPSAPRYGELNPNLVQNPASVGKIMVALGLFQALADVYPNDVEARTRVLRETIVTANEFIIKDHHEVPFWKPGDPKVVSRIIEQGDQANLYTYLDWMLSVSSSAAASMVQEQTMLLRHFGTEYPASPEASDAYFADTPKSKLGSTFTTAMRASIESNGLSWGKLRQGSFFTRTGKNKVPGTNSLATARQLLLLLTRMEEGKLVDSWSSTEIKRLLYQTDRRIRYASAPILEDSGVYFKSGSFYGCKEEAGFVCGKYMGNRMNYMNSVIIVEEEKDGRSLRYIVALLSNVLRKNSAVEHQTLGTRIHQLIHRLHEPATEPAPQAPVLGSPQAPVLESP